MDNMEKKTLKLNTDLDDLLDAFELERNFSCASLDKWLSAKATITTIQADILEQKRSELLYEGDGWNEEELKMHFLAFLFDIAQVKEPNKIKLFFERPLAAQIQGYELNVVCDAILATPKGIGKMKKPYFFLQEFKKQKNAGDAEGQMLTAMLIAQAKNNDEHPVYGSWVQGRHWVFATLLGNNYCISKYFDATEKEDLVQIIYALKELKQIILKRI